MTFITRFNSTLGTVLPIALAMQISVAHAQDLQDLLDMPLDSLTEIQVTSVSKKIENAAEAPAAIYVITQEDIHRMGVTSIPEALRIVPGIQVAQAGSHQWSITSRGLNDQFANKLLVLLDGRTIYTPLFSGVYWDVQDTMMEDIDRIEVIRGPGATLWGANAVNGVINIITKHSKDTQGNLAVAGAGNYEQGFGSFRHGGKIGDTGSYRGYAKHFNRDDSKTPMGANSGDSWQMSQGGFRADWTQNTKDNFTLQGDVYTGSNDNNFTLPILDAPFASNVSDEERVTGGNVLARWGHKVSDTSESSLQVYYDYAGRDSVVLESMMHTLDVDFQNNWTASDRHEITWGLGYRLVHDELSSNLIVSFDPDSRTTNLFSAFAQDKISLVPNKLFLTLGSKFEHNDYTGFELQPSGKLSWLIDDKQTAWASIARAVRTPSRGNSDVLLAIATLPPSMMVPLPGFIASVGNSALDSEVVIAYEAGYRIQPITNLSFDTAVFYNEYSKQLTGAPGAPVLAPTPPPHVIYPLGIINGNDYVSYGAEIAVKWNVANWWQLQGSYNFLNFQFDHPDIGPTYQGKSPKHQFSAMSTMEFPHEVTMSNMLYFVDNLPGIAIDGYYRLDTQIAWEPKPGIELSIVGQNLLDNRHPEFTPFVYGSQAEVGRSVYGKVTWQF